jgi:hypothetical protein
MRSVALLFAAASIAGTVSAQQSDTHSVPAKSKYTRDSYVGKKPLTRAERTGFTETSHYDDVITFIDSLEKLGAKVARGSIAKTIEGRELPYVIASRPLITTPAAGAAAHRPNPDKHPHNKSPPVEVKQNIFGV